jgi:hypothetical protein
MHAGDPDIRFRIVSDTLGRRLLSNSRHLCASIHNHALRYVAVGKRPFL